MTKFPAYYPSPVSLLKNMLHCLCIQTALLALSRSKLNDIISNIVGYVFLSALQNGVSNIIEYSEYGNSIYLKSSSTPVPIIKIDSPFI